MSEAKFDKLLAASLYGVAIFVVSTIVVGGVTVWRHSDTSKGWVTVCQSNAMSVKTNRDGTDARVTCHPPVEMD